MEQNKDTYEAYIFCDNCRCHKKIVIDKGKRIEDVECLNCGNSTLKIDPNGELFDRPRVQPNYR